MKTKSKENPVVQIRRAIEKIIRNEIEDGHTKLDDARQWGDTGTDIVTASGMAFDAIDSITGEDAKDYLCQCMAALHKAHLRYRRDYDDESGYGSEALHSIKSMVASLAKDHGVKLIVPTLPDTILLSNATLDELDDAALVTETVTPPAPHPGIVRRLLSLLGL